MCWLAGGLWQLGSNLFYSFVMWGLHFSMWHDNLGRPVLDSFWNSHIAMEMKSVNDPLQGKGTFVFVKGFLYIVDLHIVFSVLFSFSKGMNWSTQINLYSNLGTQVSSCLSLALFSCWADKFVSCECIEMLNCLLCLLFIIQRSFFWINLCYTCVNNWMLQFQTFSSLILWAHRKLWLSKIASQLNSFKSLLNWCNMKFVILFYV